MPEPFVAFDARVGRRGILVAAEGEDGLVHLFGVEDLHLDPAPVLDAK